MHLLHSKCLENKNFLNAISLGSKKKLDILHIGLNFILNHVAQIHISMQMRFHETIYGTITLLGAIL